MTTIAKSIKHGSNRQKQVQTAIKPAKSYYSRPQPSVVQVYFPTRKMTLAYFNDIFHLQRGDIVFVDGKMAGLQGRVMEISYNFKIKLSEYKRIVAIGDTKLKGRFYLADSHFLTFDEAVMPMEKIKGWFFETDGEEYISSNNDKSFLLKKLSEMKISQSAAERGKEYYLDDKVLYLCIDDIYGFAIVEGSKYYTVEFRYEDGKISKLTCDCYCSEHCKHEFAVMLQLQELLKTIEKDYAEEFAKSSYFSAISKITFLSNVMHSSKRGSFVMK